jgi:hypothetical protein
MKQFAKTFLRLSLLLAIGVVSGLQAASCDDCSDFSLQSCGTSCNTSNNCSNDCISSSSTCGNCCSSIYIPRPTINNTAYFWSPWRKDIDCEFNGYFDLGFEYQRSFSHKHISRALFGGETIHLQGSGITGAARDPRALIADNFGLSATCDQTIGFKPRIQNFNLNFRSHFGFDNWVEGLYGEVNFVFTHQQRNLHITNGTCSTSTLFNGYGSGCSNSCDNSNTSFNCSTGCSNNNSCGTLSTGSGAGLNASCLTPFAAGYMGAGVVPTLGTLTAALTGQTFGDMTTPWAFGQFPFHHQKENRVAGVALVAGWNFWQSDCSHFGLFFQYIAPTGNRPNPTHLFSAVVGNGKHHEVYGGLSTHYELWNNDCDQALNVYLDGYAGSALSSCQTRSFDFAGKGCLSRYMLLEEVTPATGTPTAFAGALINGINFTTRKAKVKISVKGDATLRFVYSNGGFNFGFGYNVYGQAKESLYLTNGLPTGCNGAALNTSVGYAFKGCAPITPFATQSTATINTCGVNDTIATAIGNPVGIAPATSCSTSSLDTLSNGILDLNSGAAPKQFTNKGFFTLDYTWAECSYAPYLGMGVEAEGGSRKSMNQFGVWIKGGIQF